jgi:hypothetical protein
MLEVAAAAKRLNLYGVGVIILGDVRQGECSIMRIKGFAGSPALLVANRATPVTALFDFMGDLAPIFRVSQEFHGEVLPVAIWYVF